METGLVHRAWAPGAAFLVAAHLKGSGRDPVLLEPEAWALDGGWSHSVILGTGVLDMNFLMRQQPPAGSGEGACAWCGVSRLSQPREVGLHLRTGPFCQVPASEL